MEDKYGIKNKTVLCFDFGSQIQVAQRLSKDFGKVLYYIPSVINGFEDHKAHDIGRGVEGVERVYDWWDYYDEIDLFVFTDIYMGGLQEFLRSRGKLVFGSGKAGKLETDRLGFKELIKELGLPVNEYDVANGIDELDFKLKSVEDRYIKSNLRGDMETFHHTNYVLSKTELKRMKHDYGVYDKQETFIIESPIESIAEIGYDGYCIQGAYPDVSCCGIEIKDVGYLGRMTRYNELPKQVTDVNDKIAPIMQGFDYRCAFSSEIRITKEKVGYFIDTTNRFPEPNTSLTLEMYDNYSEIIWEVANGIVPKIQAKYNWGCEFIIKSELAKTEPVAIQFPEKYKDNIKIKNLVVDENGTSYFTPNNVEMCEIGAVVACGKTMEEAVKMATEISKTVKGFDIKINTDCIEDAKNQMKELNKNGIRFI
jgi:hypothetical protein